MSMMYAHEQFEEEFLQLLRNCIKAAKDTGNGKILSCHFTLQFTNRISDPKFEGVFKCPVIEKDN